MLPISVAPALTAAGLRGPSSRPERPIRSYASLRARGLDTVPMPQWYVVVSIRTTEPMTDFVLDRSMGFRPPDDEQCIWVDEEDRTLLHATIEFPAPDSRAAVQAGRDMAHAAILVMDSAADVVDVVAVDVDDESGIYFRWTPTAPAV
jgi:hypothetical protein